MIFKKVSFPYKKLYGEPEDELRYRRKNIKYIDWIWWERGFLITFQAPSHNTVDGWEIAESHFLYSRESIKH